jgi:hypothetical protein
MKKIIRLTESDLHNIIQHSVKRVLREETDKNLVLQSIAQKIANQGHLSASVGENDADFDLDNGMFAYITCDVDSSPYIHQGMRSSSYDVPDDDDEIIDELSVEVQSIEVYDEDGETSMQIHDNGLIKRALESVISINYDDYDIPSEEEYFYYED